jgi:cytochrome c peroxidase
MKYLLVAFFLIILGCPETEKSPIPKNSCKGFKETALVITKPSHFPPATIPTDLTEERFQLGRHLFNEKKISRNNTTACGSCHQQSLAFTDGRKKAVGLYGDTMSRGVPSLTNRLWEDKFLWNGGLSSFQAMPLVAIQTPVEFDITLDEVIERLEADTLYQRLFCEAYGVTKFTPAQIGESISTFITALVSANSKYDKTFRGEAVLTPTEELGRKLFFTHPIPGSMRGGNCGDCHRPPLTNGILDQSGMKNNGLDLEGNWTDLGFGEVTGEANDNAKFKTPTLRNIEFTAPYMHDGRFETLEEVMTYYNEHVNWSPTIDPLMFASNGFDSTSLQLGLLPFEIDAIIQFMKTLSDPEFVNNPRFSDPFKK